ncbi:hypothetical protein D3C80_1358160 [compost metagenome]
MTPVTNAGLEPRMSVTEPVIDKAEPVNGVPCSPIRSLPEEALATRPVPDRDALTAETRPARFVTFVFRATGKLLAPRNTVKLSDTTSKLKRAGAALPVTIDALPGTAGVPGTSGS